MKTYREQDGCHNCVEYEVKYEYLYHDTPTIRCKLKGDHIDTLLGEVNPWGICDKHRRQQ